MQEVRAVRNFVFLCKIFIECGEKNYRGSPLSSPKYVKNKAYCELDDQ